MAPNQPGKCIKEEKPEFELIYHYSNSVSAQNLILLGAYFEDQNFKSKATTLTQFFSNVSPMGYVLPEMLSAFLLEDTGLHMLVVVGEFVSVFHRTIYKFNIFRSRR